MVKDSSNSFALVLALVAVFSGSWLYLDSRPLKSERPSQQAGDHQDATGGAMVRARLWQDPLQPIQQHWNGITSYIAQNGSTPPGATLPSTIAKFANELARFEGKQLRLVVLTPGGPYSDDIEQRGRNRYAIVSALTEADFVPQDGEHIGYFVAPSFNLPDNVVGDYQTCLRAEGSSPDKCFLGEAHVTIGYEFFDLSHERKSEAPRAGEPSKEEDARKFDWESVVVFWVNEDDIAAAPLNAIEALMAAIDRPTKGMSERATVVVGPSTSGKLQTMYLTAKRDAPADAEFVREADTYGDDFHTLVFEGKRRRSGVGADPFKVEPEIKVAAGNAADIQSLLVVAHDESDSDPAMSDTTIRSELAEARESLIILSPRATAPLDFLLGDERFAVLKPDEESRRIADERLTSALGIARFRSVIERDDLVLRNVLVELDARGACDQADPTIAVVSEQDSPYGRFIDNVIAEQADLLSKNGAAHRAGRAKFPRGERVGCRFEVQEFGYLRGVDGELPPGTLSPELSVLATEDVAPATDPAALGQVSREQAVGVAQLDYVRRLADTIERKRLEGRGANFVAIGILGTDVYDKRLILQALRERLPWVTFFTTDLDARLSDADALRWTKNLLVASAYGNVLEDRKGAAFRDVYQTSIYRAVQVALSISSDDDIEGRQFTTQTIPGAETSRLFEISRSGARELPSAGVIASGEDGELWTPDARSVMAGVLLLLPLFGLAVGTWVILRQISRDGQERWHLALAISGRAALAVAGVLALLLGFWNKLFDEPWLLFEGISSVPTLVLHVTTAVFAGCLMLMTFGRIVQGNRDVAGEFKLPTRDALAEFSGKRSLFRISTWAKEFGPLFRISTWRDRQFRISTWTRKLGPLKRKQKGSSVQEIWRRYLALNRTFARIVRIAFPVVFWSSVAMYIFRVDPAPMLSHGMHGILGLVRDCTVVLVLATVFYCTDALHLGQTLVRALARQDVKGWKNQRERHKKAAEATKEPTNEPTKKLTKEPFDDYTWRRRQTIQLIVATTEFIGPVVVFPFVLMFLLIVARNPLFEGWVWSTNLLLFYVGFGGHILVRALRFQFEAANARDEIRHDLEENRYVVEDEDQAKNLEFAIMEIQGIDRGAFVPWTRNPILQSLALPSSGLGLITIANAFLQ